ncbi:hypothetical protein NEF87_003791 [Candidatus Lokiarchaeum ossiferum]|uniref:SH3 domain-containing protein n=1 Tax=Candidatus Lokiarchaeum ossiferum TaxID=2951803 RepID=A0ABY6HY49_9ARCH|nr:hypothetical protein NEF87_003791 [Candidatus Lokiarchaeum sp. B-35]
MALKTSMKIYDMDHHRQSFFGQKTGLLLDSANITDPFIYLRFLQKKPSGQWEKPSQKEGKNIKLNLLEIIQVIRIFSSETAKWSTVHKFGDENTSITVERSNGTVNFFVSGYNKYFKYPETKLFADLLDHIYHEKIENATGSKQNQISQSNISASSIHSSSSVTPNIPTKNISSSSQSSMQTTPSYSDQITQLKSAPIEYPPELDDIPPTPSTSPKLSFTPEEWFNALQQKEEFRLVPGDVIRTSGKALAFQILGHNEIWVPNSCVNNVNDSSTHGLWIKEWFLKKKIDDIFSTSA